MDDAEFEKEVCRRWCVKMEKWEIPEVVKTWRDRSLESGQRLEGLAGWDQCLPNLDAWNIHATEKGWSAEEIKKKGADYLWSEAWNHMQRTILDCMVELYEEKTVRLCEAAPKN